MNTPTPTPRTDAAWASSFEPCEYRAAHTARTMRECSQQLETELAAERARLDWIESDAGVDWQWNDIAGGIVSRAAIDAAMKEHAK